MPNYSYKAISDSGKIVRGKIIALGEKDAELMLQQEGFTLIASKQVQKGYLQKILYNTKIKPRLLIELYRRLSQTLTMGLPIIAALEENSKMFPSKTVKRTLHEIRISIQGGKTMHEAMSGFKKIFSKLDLGIIQMGEEAGIMPKCFTDLADFHEWKENIKSTIKKAAIYPCFVMLALLGVIGVWVGYVLPQMAGLLNEMGVTIPGMTRLVLTISQFISTNWQWLFGVIAAFIVLLFLLQTNRNSSILFQKNLLRVPLVGKAILNIALARLCHYFAAMHNAGMPMNAIFEILTDGVLGNKYIESRLAIAYEKIQLGNSIASSFKKSGGFPLLLVSGIKNGEVTGTLDEAFVRLGDFYDGEVKRSVQTMLSNIEPLTIIILGSVFGLIILSILLPLYDVFGQLEQAY
jgi:type IV pilus assembly protein PilC